MSVISLTISMVFFTLRASFDQVADRLEGIVVSFGLFVDFDALLHIFYHVVSRRGSRNHILDVLCQVGRVDDRPLGFRLMVLLPKRAYTTLT